MTTQVYDRGPREHATGTVSGSTYTVAAGDTFYSIGLRFGLPYQDITRANSLADDAWVVPGTQLRIPGLGSAPPAQPSLGINSPTYGSSVNLAAPLTVSGVAANLGSSRVIVRVKDQYGRPAATVETTPDRAGHWQVTFSPRLPLTPNPPGSIEAEAPANNLRLDVAVTFR